MLSTKFDVQSLAGSVCYGSLIFYSPRSGCAVLPCCVLQGFVEAIQRLYEACWMQ